MCEYKHKSEMHRVKDKSWKRNSEQGVGMTGVEKDEECLKIWFLLKYKYNEGEKLIGKYKSTVTGE